MTVTPGNCGSPLPFGAAAKIISNSSLNDARTLGLAELVRRGLFEVGDGVISRIRFLHGVDTCTPILIGVPAAYLSMEQLRRTCGVSSAVKGVITA
jgi:hypothetical protein